MSPPRPIARRVSTAAAAARPARISTTLHHPTPDLQSLQGAYRGNIHRLERSAERLSQASSDLGEEIRKMIAEEKERERSRNSSLQSSEYNNGNHNTPYDDDSASQARQAPTKTAREGSRRSYDNNSYTNSIVDVNAAARWGGYSPGGFITSPVESVRSGSWAMSRAPSAPSKSQQQQQQQRLSQMVEPMQEGRPLDSPLAPSSESLYSQEQQMSRRASQSSFARRYDLIAAQIENSLQAVPATSPVPEDLAEPTDDPHVLDTRPSIDTLNGFENAFKDFDGVHFSPDTEEYVEVDGQGNEVRRVSARTSSGSLLNPAPLLRAPAAPRPMSYAAPPPGGNMVYYPAPVPRVLNLPKRLSQMPAPSVQAQRRSQMLSDLSSSQTRHSAPWLSQSNLSDAVRSQQSGSDLPSSPPPQQQQQQQPQQRRSVLNPRASMAPLSSLPPQLRASAFFEHQSIPQDVEIKSESAVATLDSILAASATAPVSVFTDHPYAGDVRKTVYAPEVRHAPKRSSTTLAALTQAEKKPTKRRSASIGRLFRKSSNDLDEELRRPSSRSSTVLLGSEDGKKLMRRRSHLSLGDELERPASTIRTPADEAAEPDASSGLIAQASNADRIEARTVSAAARPSTALAHDILTNTNEQIEDDFRNENNQEDIDESEPVYAAPTTLLAELQVRKAQQKSRNRTAATAYPNGMHSTLLELDAVEEINRKNRKKQRVALAWEDPGLRAQEEAGNADDDDVPLGMLFPPKDGQKSHNFGDARDWQRPLGLMEKRALEDSEPLSSRRNRLNGLPPSRASLPLQPTVQLVESTNEEAEAGEDVGETLGQRIRRLKTKDALDSTISEFAPKDGERPMSTFTDDVLSQFGGLDVKEQEGKSQPTPKDVATRPDEEETLGQRRARLQRERGASGEQEAHPAVRSSQSLANLLAAHPVGSRPMGKDKQPAYGSLLHASAQAQSKHKQDLLNKNLRSGGMTVDGPLVDAQYSLRGHHATPTGLLGSQTSMPAVGGFANGAYNNGSGGAIAAAAPPMFGVSGTNTYFASPTAAYGMGYNGMMPAHPQVYAPQLQQLQQQQPQAAPMVNPMAYSALNGGRMSTMMPVAPTQGYAGMMGGGGGAGYGAPMQPMGYGGGGGAGLGMEMGGMQPPSAPMDNQQRAAIDRWRMSVAP